MDKNKNVLLIVALVAFSVMIMFSNKYMSLLQAFETSAKAKEAQIARYIDLCSGFVGLLTNYGEDFLEHESIPDSQFFEHLHYDPVKDLYHSDALIHTDFWHSVGNITGRGPIPEDPKGRAQVNLALHFNKDFSRIYKELPEAAWVYYTGEQGFIFMYPWISSQDFSFSEAIHQEVFYQNVTPVLDPLRKPLWVPVYLDHAGKGLMVTLSSPIYKGNTFMGAVSIDLTNQTLSRMIESEYEIYLIDDTDSVIASSQDVTFKDEVVKLDSLLRSSPDDIIAMQRLPRQELRQFGGHYIYSAVFQNAPWRMFFRVPVILIVYKSLLYITPILAIGLMLVFTAFEISKRITAEDLQKQSMEALITSQKRLEDSAKLDYLTSVCNRRGFREWFDRLRELNPTSAGPIALILGDIDHFKRINDTFGHAAGDKVLMEISKILTRNLSPFDAVCRWGGEEFLILLPSKSEQDALRIAEIIRKDIEAAGIPWENAVLLKATMTFGVAASDLETSLDDSVQKADMALYLGKKRGRNIAVSYQEIGESL